MASKQDPDGKRTVGVITKCDVAQHQNQVSDAAYLGILMIKDSIGYRAGTEQGEAS